MAELEQGLQGTEGKSGAGLSPSISPPLPELEDL